MLRAEEFRIGNIISLTGKPIRISFSTLEKLCFPELSKYQMYEGKFKPIKLTEDILLKCGFELYNSIDWIRQYKLNGVYFTYVIEQNKLSIVDYKHVKYLHQLQNLYFALTGKELEVNL